MKRIWIHSLLIGSIALAGASAAFAQSRSTAKASASSKSKKTTTSSATSANGRATATATAGPGDDAKAAKDAVPFEVAQHKFKGVAPASWIRHDITGNASLMGPEIGWMLPSDSKPSRKSSSSANAEVKRVVDTIEVDLSPLIDPMAALDTVVDDVKAELKAEDPDVQIKPVEKTKIGGMDGAIVTSTLAPEEGGTVKRMVRRVVFVRDGKRFQISLDAHANSLPKHLNAFNAFTKAFEFTAPPSEAAELLKQYDNAAHNVKYAIPASWETVGAGCHGSIASFLVPMDELSMPPKRADGSRTMVADMLFVAVNPAADPKGSFDAAIQGKQALLQGDMKAMKFKPVEKTKLPSGEAAILTGTMPGRAGSSEPEKVYRYILTLRDGKLYEVILYSHANSIARQTPVQEKIASSLAFADAAPKATPATATPAQQPGAADGF